MVAAGVRSLTSNVESLSLGSLTSIRSLVLRISSVSSSWKSGLDILEIASDWLRSPLGCWRYDVESPAGPVMAPVIIIGILRELELLDITEDDTEVGEAGDNDL